MPSRGINFAVPKQRKKLFSQNPRTTATRQWEKSLTGLSLAYRRADKAATVARSRAITKLTKRHDWTSLSSEEQQRLIEEAVEKANINRDLKKKQAKDEWSALHGDTEEEAMKIDDADEEMEDYDDEEDYTKEGEEGEGEEEENDENDNDNDDDEVSEYISEAEEGEDKSDQELMEESRKALNEDLLSLMKRQGEEHSAFIKQIEEMAMAWEGKEVPYDYVFGVIE